MLGFITHRGSRAAWLTATFAVLLFACSPPDDPDAPSEKALATLLAEHATRERVELTLGKGYTWYEKGTSGWNANYSTSPDRVREATKHYSRLMHYTTVWQRTWIFLDDNDVMRAYFTGSQ